MYDVIVIGGGPSGLMAAIAAAERQQKVLLLEKGNKLGKKLYFWRQSLQCHKSLICRRNCQAYSR